MTFPSEADIAASYDTAAADYAATYYDELTRKPFDRALLGRFAAAIHPGGLVVDIGTGPGHIARHLADQGLRVQGVDLSPEMVAIARRLSPGIPFTTGTMTELGFDDGALAGVTAFYSLIHLPRHRVAEAIDEFRRVLAPGGRLLIAVHGGEGELFRDEWNGHPVKLGLTLFSLDELAGLLGGARFDIVEAVSRPPYESEHATERLYVVATAASEP